MAVDLSTLKSNTTEGPSINSLSEAEREALAAMAEKHQPAEDVEEVRTAFLVLVHHDGAVEVRPDLSTKVDREEIPNTLTVFQAASTIAKDIQVQETAQHTAVFMQQAAMQMQQQMQAAKLAQGLKLK